MKSATADFVYATLLMQVCYMELKETEFRLHPVASFRVEGGRTMHGFKMSLRRPCSSFCKTALERDPIRLNWTTLEKFLLRMIFSGKPVPQLSRIML